MQERNPFMKTKRIQIPEELYKWMVSYIQDHFDVDDSERYRRILMGIEEKQAARTRHNAYTTYKTDQDPEMREMARQVYLDSVGMRQSFRWPADKNPWNVE